MVYAEFEEVTNCDCQDIIWFGTAGQQKMVFRVLTKNVTMLNMDNRNEDGAIKEQDK